MEAGYQDPDIFHAQNVEHTLAELQSAVKDHEAALRQLEEDAVAPHFEDDATAARASLAVMAQAYDDAARSEPFLPFAKSVLPALLAMRQTHQTIVESQAYLKAQGVSLENAKKRLEIERGNRADQKALETELHKRIESLRQKLDSGSVLTPEEILQNQIVDLRQQNNKFKHDRKQLMVDLGKFIREHLGKKLALEQYGGPVVGDAMEIDSDDLATSRSQQSKKRKRLKKNQSDQPGDDEVDEAASAAEGLQELVENLLAASAERPQAYVAVEEGSVAAIYLVRCKVAQFHPQDSTRLRLIDFGRDFED